MPAVKVPSASSVKIASAVVCAVKIRCTLVSSIMFITKRNANQCSACVTISRNRPALSPASCHPAPTQTSAMIGARIFPVSDDRLFRKARIGDAGDGEDQYEGERQFPDPEARRAASQAA